MNQKENLTQWFHEMDAEKPSPDFSRKVMQDVMTDWRLNPTTYTPMITRKAWLVIIVLSFLLVIALSIMNGLVANTSYSSSLAQSSQINPLQLLEYLNNLFEKLNNISPAVGVGTLAIIALWFFDQLFSKLARR